MVKRLPRFIHQYFWDTNPLKIDREKNRSYIIKRLLGQNDLRTLGWLLANFSQKKFSAKLLAEELNQKTGLQKTLVNQETILGKISRENIWGK